MEYKPEEAWNVSLTSKKCVDGVRPLDNRKVESVLFDQVFSGERAPWACSDVPSLEHPRLFRENKDCSRGRQ